MTKPHHKLKVWEKSRNFVKAIYQITTKLPDEEKFGLTSQMRRAAISIPSNIAEGAGRNSRKEFANFLGICQGSIAELETQILIGQDLVYFQNNLAKSLLDELDEISKMIIGLKKIITEKMLTKTDDDDYLYLVTRYSSLVTEKRDQHT
jgi:four helix bundle protein